MEIFIPINWGLAWLISAIVLFPILGYVFTKLDLDVDDDSETSKVMGGAALCAAIWPIVLSVALAALVLVYPTYIVIERTKTNHHRRKREAATEKAVLAKLEAEKKAEDEAIKREIEGADPMGFDPEPKPPHKSPQGKMRKAQNDQFYIEVGWPEKRKRPTVQYKR